MEWALAAQHRHDIDNYAWLIRRTCEKNFLPFSCGGYFNQSLQSFSFGGGSNQRLDNKAQLEPTPEKMRKLALEQSLASQSASASSGDPLPEEAGGEVWTQLDITEATTMTKIGTQKYFALLTRRDEMSRDDAVKYHGVAYL